MTEKLKNIKNSISKTNNKNLIIQSFLMIGFAGAIGATFGTPYNIIPALLLGPNIPIFLMELSVKKYIKNLKNNKTSLFHYSLFSKNFRYNQDLKKNFLEYINDSTTETEKKYKTFYLNLWSLSESLHDIHEDNAKFKDYFFFQAIKSNIALYKEGFKKEPESSRLTMKSEENTTNKNFFNINGINDYSFHEPGYFHNMVQEYKQMEGEDKKRIENVVKDFEEFGFLGEAIISLFILNFNLKYKTDAFKYLRPKKFLTANFYKNNWTKDLDFVSTMLTLQNFTFNDYDRNVLNRFLEAFTDPKFKENIQYNFGGSPFKYSDLIQIFKTNTLKDAENLKKLNDIIHFQVISPQDSSTYLSTQDITTIFEKEYLSKKLHKEHPKNTTNAKKSKL